MMFSKVIEVLKEFGGYFTFSDEEGVEYIVIPKDDFDDLRESVEEVQLMLPTYEKLDDREVDGEVDEVGSANDMLEKINRDIALFKLAQEQEDMSEDFESAEESETKQVALEPTIEHIVPREEEQKTQTEEQQMEPPRRVRFEPIHGDLPPELQE